jgi:hypothetical protein
VDFEISVLPFIAVWLLLAPFIAGYGPMLITIEGFAGLAVSIVLILLVGANMMKEEYFQIDTQAAG